MNVGQTARFWRKVRMPALVLIVAISSTVLAVGGWNLMGSMNDRQNEFVFYAVARSDLPIVVTERGNLESQDAVQIRCQVDALLGAFQSRGCPAYALGGWELQNHRNLPQRRLAGLARR